MQNQINRIANKHLFSKLLLFIFAFLLPTQFGKHFFLSFSYLSGVRTDYLAPTIYTTDILVFILLFFHTKTFKKLFRNMYIQIVFLLLSITLLFAISKEIALYQYVKIVEIVAIIAIVKDALKSDLPFLFYGFFTGSILEFILSIFQFVSKHSQQGLFYFLGERSFTLSTPSIAKASLNGYEFLRPYGTFSHPNSLGGFFVVLYALFFIKPKRVHWLVHTLFLFVLSSLVILSFSKIAVISWLFINILMLIVHWNDYKECMLCLISRLCVLVLPLLFVLTTTTTNQSVPIRVELIQHAFLIIKKYWLTGIGLRNYLILEQQFPSNRPYFFAQPVHNIFLLLLSEVGLPIGFFLLFLLIRIILKSKKNLPFLLAVTALVITGLFDHYWLTLQQNMLLLGVVGGFYFSIVSAF